MTDAPATAAPLAAAPDRRARVETLLTDVLRLMEYPASLDFKDLSDGSLGVAMRFEGELPGIAPGKRSYLIDCLQFLINKCINRPGVEKRWVSLGVGGFPDPRPPRPASVPAPVPVPSLAPAPLGTSAGVSARPSRPPLRPAVSAPRPGRADEDERARVVGADPLITQAAESLAGKSAKLGRYFAVMMLSPDDRARMLKATEGIRGVSVRTEGEGHWRRVAFVPDKPVAIPKKFHLMSDDEEE